MNFIWHNGDFIDETAPVFTAHTRMRRGECVFNTMLAVDGRIVRAEAHMEKLLRDARVFWGEDFKIFSTKKLIDSANQLLQKNNFLNSHYAINVILTPDDAGKTSITIRAQSAPEHYPPIHAVIAQSTRRNEGSPLSLIKCANYSDNLMALREAESNGANEAILLNNLGQITCATMSNVFIVKKGVLLTPPLSDGANEGITRTLIIEKFGAIEQSLTPDDLYTSEGIYLTSSIRGALPVITLDKIEIPTPSLKIPGDFHLS